MSLARLTTEARNPASEGIDRLSSLEIVRLINAEDATVPAAVERVAPAIAAAIDAISQAMRRGGRLIYVGAGTSGRLGVLDASECPPTFNSPPWQVVGIIAGGATALTRAVEGAEDDPQQAVTDLRASQLSDADVLVGIATSGRTPYVLGALRYARQIGARAIGLSCNADSELSAIADLTITPVVGPEVISGSTRLKAGTATKLVLNLLSTGAMIRLGKTYGNLMVDLQATNQKLIDRSRRIVAMLTGLDEADAAALLQESRGEVKVAVVMHRRRVSPSDARRLLRHGGEQLREALQCDLSVLAVTPPTASATSPAAASLVLGVDGGGSNTRVWLAPAAGASTEPIAIGQSGSANPQSIGWTAALANLDQAIERAFAAAGIARAPVAAACLSAAGVGRPAERERLSAWATARRIAERLRVTDDALPILAAGCAGAIGIAAISGTGSLVVGRDRHGRTARQGGWGYLLGDQGSGYEIARSALRAVARAADGRGAATELQPRLFEALQVGSATELLQRVYRQEAQRAWIASLAPHVITAADEGDAVAQRIVDQAAEELAEQIAVAAGQLDFASDGCPLALAGGVLVHAEPLRQRMLAQVTAAGVTISSVALVPDPVAGAVVLARREFAVQ